MAPVGIDLVELNRRFLEDSYPLELVKLPTASSLSDPKAILELILKVFPIGAAIVYATGFLVVSAFLDRFGINEANVEFLKVTYIQVGLLYFAFPVFVLAPIFIFFRLHNDPHATTRMPTIAVVGTLNLLFTFYWFATFAQPGEFYAERKPLACLFLWTVIAIATGRRLALAETSDSTLIDNLVAVLIDPLFKQCRRHTRTNIVRGVFGLAIIVFAVLILGNVGIILSLVVVMIFGLGLLHRCRFTQALTQGRRTMLLSVVSIVTMLGVLIVTRFLFDWRRLEHIAFYYIYCGITFGFLWKEITSIRLRYSNRERTIV
jgi:hypothetical protein